MTMVLMGILYESQAFAYLAIRCIEKLPLHFHRQLDALDPCLGGEFLG